MRWITAHNLQEWSNSLAARTEFPGLIADLIVASASDISEFRFPSREKGQVRGFDGVLKATGVPPFVPDGDSIWEFGVTGDVVAKADEDFVKRTKEVDRVVRANTTFVFATPRTWDRPSKQIPDWLNEKRALGEWKGVECFDGVKLEHWLDSHPAVASHYARYELGLAPNTGACSAGEFWTEFATRFAPKLAESVLLAGREAQATELLHRLGDGGSKLAYAADSADEVIAFVIAAIRSAPPDVRAFLDARVIVVDSADAARHLATKKGLIFLPRGQARQLVGLLAQAGPTVVSAGADDQRGQHDVLARPTNAALAKAFASMGIPEAEGYELARTCGRSLAVLARQRPSGTAEQPEWLRSSEALLPALLAGAWKPSVDADAAVLRTLGARATYEEVEAPLRPLTKLKDPPVDRVGDVWTMRSSVDAFVHLGHLIGGEHLERFAEAAKLVFSRVVERPKADDVFRRQDPQPDQHSRWLREGMMTTLLHMAALHEEAGFVITGSSPQNFVDGIVRNLPNLSSDYRLLESLRDHLPLLAEAAPGPFFDALERLLEGDAEKIAPIFSESDDFFAPASAHTGVLWALETLAWDTNYLLRAAMCLAKLAAIDPGGKLSNRPINSLRDILLSWAPHTNAPYKYRIGVISHVVKIVPAIAWEFLVKLLPKSHDSASETHKPKFAEASPGGAETLTYGVVWETQAEVVKLAVSEAGIAAERWRILIDVLGELRPESFDFVVSALGDCLQKQGAGERHSTWDALRKEINRHRTYSDTDWALPEEALRRLDALADKFEPADTLLVNAWLFDDWMPDVAGKHDERDPMEAIESARMKALSGIVSDQGVKGVAAMAAQVKLPLQMAASLGMLELSLSDRAELVRMLLAMDGEANSLATVVVAQAYDKFGASWIEVTRQLVSELHLSAEQTAKLFMSFADTKEIWGLVATFGVDVDREYWRQKAAFSFRGTADDLDYAVERYQNCGRALAAIEATHRRLQDVASSRLLAMLDAAIPEINASARNGAAMLEYYIEHLFDELEKRADVAREELARMEFAYLPFFTRRKRTLTLHKMLVESPEFFVSTLSAVFKSATGEPPVVSKEQRRHATAAYELLNSLEVLPGQVDSHVDVDVLSAWCDGVRQRAAEVDRTSIAEARMGHLLAHAPIDPKDHVWPHASVRRTIDRLSSDTLEEAVRIERFNMRGVYGRGIGEGGRQERELAEQAMGWSRAMPEFPRTARLLAAIAEMWAREGSAADERAAKDALRW